MAVYDGAYIFQVTDVNGDTAEVSVAVAAGDTSTIAAAASAAAALATAIQATTNGKITSQGFRVGFIKAQISAGTAPPPANATYPSVTDGARLTFANSAGGRRSVTVPAPLLTDFITGSNTVNASDTNIAALITAVEAVSDIGGGATNLYEGGVKVGRHARRRTTRKHL